MDFFCSSCEICQHVQLELTLIIELIVLERSSKETAKVVILCVHAGLYAFWHSLGLQTSLHILHYMRLTRLLVTSSYFY